jgi:hypothetical protein
MTTSKLYLQVLDADGIRQLETDFLVVDDVCGDGNPQDVDVTGDDEGGIYVSYSDSRGRVVQKLGDVATATTTTTTTTTTITTTTTTTTTTTVTTTTTTTFTTTTTLPEAGLSIINLTVDGEHLWDGDNIDIADGEGVEIAGVVAGIPGVYADGQATVNIEVLDAAGNVLESYELTGAISAAQLQGSLAFSQRIGNTLSTGTAASYVINIRASVPPLGGVGAGGLGAKRTPVNYDPSLSIGGRPGTGVGGHIGVAPGRWGSVGQGETGSGAAALLDPRGYTIGYQLTRHANIEILVFSTSGQLVWKGSYSTRSNGGRAGHNQVYFDGRTLSGTDLPRGMYVGEIVDKDGRKVLGKFTISVQ